MAAKIKKGDRVVLLTGRDKGRTGQVTKVLPKDGRVFVGVGATICERVDDTDFELVNMDVASARVDTIDQVLDVIREAVSTTLN